MNSDQEWFYLEGEDRKGPFDIAAMRQLLQAGVIEQGAWVAKQGDTDWSPAEVALAASADAVEQVAPTVAAEDPTIIRNPSTFDHCGKTVSGSKARAFQLGAVLIGILAVFMGWKTMTGAKSSRQGQASKGLNEIQASAPALEDAGKVASISLEDLLVGTWNGTDGMKDQMIFRKNGQFEITYFSPAAGGTISADEVKGEWRKTENNSFEYRLSDEIAIGHCDEKLLVLQHTRGSSLQFTRKEPFVRRTAKLVKSSHEVTLNETQKKLVETAETKMVRVEGGQLPTGSTLARQLVQPFMIYNTELTWEEWEAVRGYADLIGYDLVEVGQGIGATHPVTHINWYQALKWCNARSEMEGLKAVYSVAGDVYRDSEIVPDVDPLANGYRLPTEAEWEWAARGGILSKAYAYSGSNEPYDVAWCDDQTPHAVGGKKPNELGLYDMSGNVREWCWDLYDDQNGHRVARGGGGADAFSGGGFDPIMGDTRAINCLVTNRNGRNDPSSKTDGNSGYGFRLSRISVPQK